MNVLVIDVGGTHVKILATGQKDERRMDSGPHADAAQMVAGVKALAEGWNYDARRRSAIPASSCATGR